MIDYLVKYILYGIHDIELTSTKTITVEEYIEDEELRDDVILEKLKDYLETDWVEIIDYKPVNEQDNLYRFTEDDVYFDYDYQADYNEKFREVVGNKDVKEILDIIKGYKQINRI